MDRASKLVVLCWALAAVALQVWLLRGAWRGLSTLVPWVFVGAAAASALDRRAVGAVLALAYVFPAVVSLVHGQYHVYFNVLWMAGLLGAILPDALRTSWRIPVRWRGPLVCWAFVVMVSATLVVAREIDFTFALLDNTAVANTPSGGWPKFVISWSLHVALIFVLGTLWFDWLLGADRRVWWQGVVTPLAVSALAMGLVAIYQLLGDFTFLNRTAFGGTGRASGTMFDANVCGAIASLWIGGAVLWGLQAGRWRSVVIGLGVTVGWLVVWATGSRTSFLAALIVSASALLALYLSRRRRSAPRALIYVAASAVGGMAVIVLLANADLGVVGPIRRIWETMPGPTVASVRRFAVRMWNRNRYGEAAVVMIQDHPWFGVGVGSFQTMLPEYARRVGGSLPPDNAQNWYRHQLAEFGLVGSAAWIAWVVVFGAFVCSSRGPPEAWLARGMLLAVAVISLVGMPAQDVSVAVTFWTAAFLYTALAGPPVGAAAPLGRRSWAVIATIVVAYGIGTAEIAATSLRVPIRAQRVGWPYSYGFHAPEPDGQRWAGRHAVAVLEAPSRWMELTVSANHLALSDPGDAGRRSIAPTRPVTVKVWRNGELVLETRLTTTAPVVRHVEVRDDQAWVMLETRVDRTFRPRDVGVPDDRELGVLVGWRFEDRAPPEGGAGTRR